MKFFLVQTLFAKFIEQGFIYEGGGDCFLARFQVELIFKNEKLFQERIDGKRLVRYILKINLKIIYTEN